MVVFNKIIGREEPEMPFAGAFSLFYSCFFVFVLFFARCLLRLLPFSFLGFVAGLYDIRFES